jgi:hypothetical protein
MKKRKLWSLKEIDFLIKNFDDKTNVELSKKLERTERSVAKKANILGLKKSKNHKSKCIAKRNKMVGRDITVELIIKESKKYKTKSEFQRKDPSLYSAARRLNVLNDVCEHMIPQSFSIPQLILKEILTQLLNVKIIYNSRRIIKPYELDIYIPDYNIAFEYNGKLWHNSNQNDLKKQMICNEKNIKLFTIKENNRKYEIEIKNQIIMLLPEINNITNLNLVKDDVNNIILGDVFSEIYNYRSLHEVCKKYTSFKSFIENEKSIYRKILKIKKIDEFTSHMKDRRKRRTTDEIAAIISKYEFLLDLIKNDQSTYSYIKKFNLNYLLEPLKRKR